VKSTPAAIKWLNNFVRLAGLITNDSLDENLGTVRPEWCPRGKSAVNGRAVKISERRGED
jgi:hypothetical protein